MFKRVWMSLYTQVQGYWRLGRVLIQRRNLLRILMNRQELLNAMATRKAEQKILTANSYFKLQDAYLCVECEVISPNSTACLACAGTGLIPLASTLLNGFRDENEITEEQGYLSAIC